MSTKSTIFLTEDNEHCYSDCSLKQFIGDEYCGDSIVMEFDKKNIEIRDNDNESLVIELTNPTSEIYKKINQLSPYNEARYYLKQLYHQLVKSGDDININHVLKEKIKKIIL